MPPLPSSVALRYRPPFLPAERATRDRLVRTARPDAAGGGRRLSRGGRVPALDGLRGLAILAVVAFHVGVMATRDATWAGERLPPPTLWPVFAGKLGVDVFFVLSGFLVLRSWRQLRARHDGDTVRALKGFALNRGRRIIPPYWFSLLLLVPLRVPDWLGTAEGWRNILVFASTNQFLDPDLPHKVNVVTWSLTTEVHFYVLVPLLAFLLARAGRAGFVALLVAVAIGWRFAVGGTGEEAEWIFGRIDQFAAGMAAASLVGAERHRAPAIVGWLRTRRAGVVLSVLGLAVALPLGALQLVPKPLAFRSTFHAVFGIVVAALLVRVASDRRRPVLEHPALRGLGFVSYSLYLWHWPLLMEASTRWGPSALVLGGALVATAAMTLLSYVLLERPFTRSATGGRARARSFSM